MRSSRRCVYDRVGFLQLRVSQSKPDHRQLPRRRDAMRSAGRVVQLVNAIIVASSAALADRLLTTTLDLRRERVSSSTYSPSQPVVWRGRDAENGGRNKAVV